MTAARKHLGALADRVNYWVIVNEKLGENRGHLRQLGQYEKKRMELAAAAYGCGLYAFANANPPLLGSPHGGREQYDAPTAPGLTHELAHWRDTDAHGLATVLAQANAHNATKSRHKHALLLHQYFKPDATMEDEDPARSAPGAPAWKTKDYPGLWQDDNPPVLTDDNEGKNVRRFERRIYAWFKDEFPHLPVVMSEYGADGRIGRAGPDQTGSLGWKAFKPWRGQNDDGRPYLAALKRLESQNQAYSDVIEGYCLFGLGLNIPVFWSYRIDPDPAGNYTGERAKAWQLSILDDLVPPRLILKNDPNDETALHVGPHAGYGIATYHTPPFDAAPGHALSGTSNTSPPEYPIVGKAGAWWQIAYRDDWHSPVWVHHDYVERFVGDTTLVRAAEPWVRGKLEKIKTTPRQPDELVLAGRYDLRREGGRVHFAWVITCAGQDYAPTTQLFQMFRIHAGFRPASERTIEVKATIVDAQGSPVPNVPEQDLTLIVRTNGDVATQFSYTWNNQPNAKQYVRYRAQDVWGQAVLTASGPRATRNPIFRFAAPLRTGPGTGCQSLEGYMVPDEGCAILGKDAAIANWWQINCEGIPCWVHKDMVHTHGDVTGVPLVLAAGTAEPVHARTRQLTEAVVRAHGDAAAAEIGRLAPGGGTRVGLTGLRRASPTWWQVQLDEVERGWVHEDQLETVGDLAPLRAQKARLGLKLTTAGLNVRAGPSASYDPVGFLAGETGGTYEIVGQDAALPTWWEIRYDATTTGWVHGAYVQTQGNLSDVQVTGAWPQVALAAGATEALAVRAGPGAGYAAAGAAALALGVDARYAIVGRNAAAETWWEIQYGPSVTGWVPDAGVQTYGPTDGVPLTWVLQAVRGLTATAQGARGLAVAWQAPAGGPAPTGYEVEYRRSDAALWTPHPRTGTDATDVLPGLEPGAAYAVRVRALGPGAPGPWREAPGATAAGPRLQLLPTTTLGLNVRVGPGTEHGIAGGIPGGSETWYAIVGQDAPAPVWWEIRFTARRTGWVHGAYVRTEGDVARVPVTWPELRIPGLAPQTIYEAEVQPARGTDRGAAQRTTATTAALPPICL